MAFEDDDDDVPRLNPAALAALKDFYTERDTREKQFEDLKVAAEDDYDNKPLSMDLFGEDWNVSQFWYNERTATILAEQLLDRATKETNIAIVSAPSVYVALKNLLNDEAKYPIKPKVVLLEYDERFAVFKKDFVLYDFAQPFKLADELKGSFDRIICDPPFLSQDCQTKTAMTVRWLANPNKDLRLISCTGERMENLIHKLYAKSGIRTTTFHPEHTKGLSNEFRCYANFECEAWKLQDSNT